MATRLTPAYFNDLSRGHLPALVGVVIVEVAEGLLRGEMAVTGSLLAPNGYLHAGSVVSLADTCAGYGCIAHLPQGATGFTTLELKANYLSTAREGTLECTATAVHLGRTTHVWDAVVTARGSEKRLALFRCTQLLLYPKQ